MSTWIKQIVVSNGIVTGVTAAAIDATDVTGGGSGTVTSVATSGSLTGGTITTTGTISLVNDSASPGNLYFYGTDAGGSKGWYAQSTISGGGGSGTVTSVGLALPSSILTVTGSPVTTTGTLTGSLAIQSPNTVWAGPGTGTGSAAPTFRALVAADVPGLPASQITSGQLAVARGGTGVSGSTAANGSLLIGNGTGYTLATLTAGSNVTITNTAGAITVASTAAASISLASLEKLGVG